jgi:hypothetical protein
MSALTAHAIQITALRTTAIPTHMRATSQKGQPPPYAYPDIITAISSGPGLCRAASLILGRAADGGQCHRSCRPRTYGTVSDSYRGRTIEAARRRKALAE